MNRQSYNKAKRDQKDKGKAGRTPWLGRSKQKTKKGVT